MQTYTLHAAMDILKHIFRNSKTFQIMLVQWKKNSHQQIDKAHIHSSKFVQYQNNTIFDVIPCTVLWRRILSRRWNLTPLVLIGCFRKLFSIGQFRCWFLVSYSTWIFLIWQFWIFLIFFWLFVNHWFWEWFKVIYNEYFRWCKDFPAKFLDKMDMRLFLTRWLWSLLLRYWLFGESKCWPTIT